MYEWDLREADESCPVFWTRFICQFLSFVQPTFCIVQMKRPQDRDKGTTDTRWKERWTTRVHLSMRQSILGRVDEVSNTWNWKKTKISRWRRGAEHVEDEDVVMRADAVWTSCKQPHVSRLSVLTWTLQRSGPKCPHVMSSRAHVRKQLWSRKTE